MEQTRRRLLIKIGLTFVGVTLTGLKVVASASQRLLHQETVPAVGQAADAMPLGAFSVSLNVRDLAASRAFYEHLGFTVFGGGMEKNYLIMKNGKALIGLFHGMFEKTLLTFNPGWDENAQKVPGFRDVRDILRQLKNKGITLVAETDEKTSGPASLLVVDPDGNQILIDQHV